MPGSFVQQILNYIGSNPLVLFIFSLTFGLLSLIMCVVSWDLIKKDRSRKSWPSVSGQIISSKVHRTVTLDLGREDVERSIPKVKFSYSVEGTAYQGELDVSYDGWQFRSKADRLVRHYPVGMVVPVYYDPQDPKKSVLQRLSARNIAGLIGGVLMLVLSLAAGSMWLIVVWSRFNRS